VPAATTTQPEAFELVSTLLSSRFEVDPAEVEPDTSLADLGLDSLAAVELFDILQERTGIPLEIDDADLALTVNELAGRLVTDDVSSVDQTAVTDQATVADRA
jgi:acyl carrier protein